MCTTKMVTASTMRPEKIDRKHRPLYQQQRYPEPVDSNNMAGIPENFPKPTVSYTVAQETGTLTVQKIVADHVEDWSFDFYRDHW